MKHSPGTNPDSQERPPAPSAADSGALAARLRGQLLRPGDPGYDDARAVWNGMIDRRPALVVRCLGTADVVACVEFARASGLTLSVKGGGHNISGLAVCDEGLLLDMSHMRGVSVNATARTARAQAGCLLGDVDRETQLHGLAAPLGFVSTTGIAGLTLGGGFGYLTRRHGWTCDSVRSVELVTADARVVRVGEGTDEELLWALRGGGGNFGVVTEFEYRTYPVGPEVTGGGIAWPERDAPEVIEQYRAFMAAAPAEATCIAVLRRAPPAPWLPPAIHGQPIVALFACHIGPAGEGAKQLEPIKRHGSPVGDVIHPRSYVSQQSLLDATQPKGRRNYWKSEYLPTLDRQLLELAMEQARQMPSPHGAILLFPIGGALNRLPGDYSAVGNRDAAWVLNIMASWEDPAQDAPNIEWARTTWQRMRSFSTGGTYINFLTEEEGEPRIRAAYGANYDRLVAIKRTWDPSNLFRTNKNIAPVLSGSASG
jgi:FAD/FMN-containing dehydrogenase